jgi:myo-inositol-1(or 4)-monophosphatase
VKAEALNTAVALAHRAGRIIRENFGKTGQVAFKGEVNPVTETDTAAEQVILEGLQAAFPSHTILGEETGFEEAMERSDGETPHWVVDPLDGTNNFAHAFPHVCVSLGLLVGGEVIVGVVYDPLRDDTFTATRGGGAALNGAPIAVSGTEALADAFLATGFPYDRRVAACNNTTMLDCFLRRSQGVRRAGAAALDLAYVASGRFDGFWEPKLSPWDVAAGLLLVEEAGGRTSDFEGGIEHLLTGEEVVANNGLIHDEMLTVLREGPDAPHPDFPDRR